MRNHRETYEAQAKVDQIRYFEGCYHHVRRREVFMSVLKGIAIKNMILLDVGCGDGWYSIPLANDGYKIIGIDLSLKRLQRLKKKGVEIVLADANKMPFRAHSFDLVFAAQFLEHMPNPEGVLKRIKEILKIDGFLLIEIPSKTNIVDYIIEVLLKKKPGWGLIIDSTHLHFFDEETVKALFRKFKLLLVKVVGAVHIRYDLPLMSYLVWDSRRRFWSFLRLLDKLLGKLKPSWGSLQLFLAKAI